MQYFLFADIHANQDALVACLTDYVLRFKPSAKTRDRIAGALKRQNIPAEKIESAEAGSGIERIIFLGDMAGYGVDVNSCAGITFDLADEMVLGNHDVLVCNPDDPIKEYVENKILFKQWAWTRGRLSRENLDQLMQLYSEQKYCVAEGNLVFSHGLPVPINKFFYYRNHQDLWAVFKDLEFREKICISGHSHDPKVLKVKIEPGIIPNQSVLPIKETRPASITVNSIESTFSLARLKNAFVSVPSVGQPRDSCPFAGYAVYDSNTKELIFRRVSYDVESVAARINALDLEIFGQKVGYFGDRLKIGR